MSLHKFNFFRSHRFASFFTHKHIVLYYDIIFAKCIVSDSVGDGQH